MNFGLETPQSPIQGDTLNKIVEKCLKDKPDDILNHILNLMGQFDKASFQKPNRKGRG